jgi:anti-sigma-K factor RskA
MTEPVKLTCEEARALMGSYALGATSPTENLAMRQHLGDCAACREEAAALLRVTRMLSLDVDPVAPPTALRQRILDAVAADVAGEAETAPAPVPPQAALQLFASPATPPRTRRPRPFWPALAAAALVAAAVLGAWNYQLRQEQPRVYGLQASGGGSGEVVYWPGQHRAFIDLKAMPDPGPGRTYQFWLIKDGTPISAGTAHPDGAHHLVVAIDRDLSGYQKLAMTDEPEGGSAAPTTTPTLARSL